MTYPGRFTAIGFGRFGTPKGNRGMTERINKLYKPAELVAAIDAVRNTMRRYEVVVPAADIVKDLHYRGFRIVYVGKVGDE